MMKMVREGKRGKDPGDIYSRHITGTKRGWQAQCPGVQKQERPLGAGTPCDKAASSPGFFARYAQQLPNSECLLTLGAARGGLRGGAAWEVSLSRAGAELMSSDEQRWLLCRLTPSSAGASEMSLQAACAISPGQDNKSLHLLAASEAPGTRGGTDSHLGSEPGSLLDPVTFQGVREQNPTT